MVHTDKIPPKHLEKKVILQLIVRFPNGNVPKIVNKIYLKVWRKETNKFTPNFPVLSIIMNALRPVLCAVHVIFSEIQSHLFNHFKTFHFTSIILYYIIRFQSELKKKIREMTGVLKLRKNLSFSMETLYVSWKCRVYKKTLKTQEALWRRKERKQ